MVERLNTLYFSLFSILLLFPSFLYATRLRLKFNLNLSYIPVNGALGPPVVTYDLSRILSPGHLGSRIEIFANHQFFLY